MAKDYPVALRSDFDADRAARFVAKARAWEKSYRAKKAAILQKADAVRARIGMVKKMSESLREALAFYRTLQEAAAKRTELPQEPSLTYTEALMPESVPNGSSVIPVRQILRGVHTPENTHFRTDWSFEVLDRFSLPDEFWIPDQEKLDKIAKAMKEQTDIPGGRAVKRLIPVVRGLTEDRPQR